MKKEFSIKKCLTCGATIEVLEDCKCDNCGIFCCGKQMIDLKANQSDGAVEKHLPNYEIVGSHIIVSVDHVMHEEHFIEYIALISENSATKKYLKIGQEAKVVFPYIKGSKLYSYCNKHGLWSTIVE